MGFVHMILNENKVIKVIYLDGDNSKTTLNERGLSVILEKYKEKINYIFTKNNLNGLIKANGIAPSVIPKDPMIILFLPANNISLEKRFFHINVAKAYPNGIQQIATFVIKAGS